MTATPEEFAALGSLISGFRLSRMVQLAAKLGVADRIPASQSVPTASLALEIGVWEDPFLRLCRALAAHSVFTVSADCMIGHSRLSLLLRTDATPSLHYTALYSAGPIYWSAWGALDQAMHGAIPFETVHGARYFDYLTSHPEQARLFDRVMANPRDERLAVIAAAYDFSTASLIVDIGGGDGALLRAILRRYPQPRGLVFDQEAVVQSISVPDRLGGRIAVEAGDFFKQKLPPADHYIMSRILHNWPDDQSLRILRNLRNAMPSGARLLLAEVLLPPVPTPDMAMRYASDLGMMVLLGGRERSLREFQALLSAANFRPVKVFETASPVSIVESITA